jgi:hypothetical protein
MDYLKPIDIWVFFLKGRLGHERHCIKTYVWGGHLHPPYCCRNFSIHGNTNKTDREKEKVQREGYLKQKRASAMRKFVTPFLFSSNKNK